MVDFNKDVKDVGNIGIGNFRPISGVVDYAGEYGAKAITALSKGVADVVEGVPKVIDTLFTQTAKAQGQEFGQAMYNAYTSKLENISGLPSTQQPSITNAEGLNANAQAAPDELIQAGDALAKNQEAIQYTKPGSPLQTLYLANITKGAKELNDRWGGANGYGDIVDNQIEKATGWNPNKYVQQLISGINQNAVNAQKEPTQVYNLLKPMIEKGAFSSDGPGDQNKVLAADILTKYRAHDPNWTQDKIENWVNRVNALDFNLKRSKDNLEYDKTFRGAQAEIYDGVITRDVAAMVHKDVDHIATNLGLKRNGEDIESFINKVLINGPAALKDPTQAQNVAEALQARENIIRSIAAKNANTPQFWASKEDKASGNKDLMRTPIEMLNMGGGDGLAKYNKIVDGQIDYLKHIRESVMAGNVSIATMATRRSQAILDQGTAESLLGPGAKFWSDIHTAKILGGDNFVEQFAQKHIIQNYGAAWVDDLIGDKKLGFITQRSWTTGDTNDPNSVKAAVDDALSRGVKSPAAFKDLINSNKVIMDPAASDDIKARQLVASFHKANFGLVSQFKEQGDVYRAQTVPEITKEAWRLGKKDPRLWDMYDAWFKNSFSEVAGPALRELNKQASEPWLHQGYNTKEMNFVVKPDRAEFYKNIDPGNRAYVSPDLIIAQQEEAAAKLNKAMAGFKTFAEVSGSDVNSYLFGVLKGLGLDNGSLASKFTDAVRTGIKAETQPVGGKGKAEKTGPSNESAPFGESPTSSIANFVQEDDRKAIETLFSRFDKQGIGDPPQQLVLDRKTGKYVPYEPGPSVLMPKPQAGK